MRSLQAISSLSIFVGLVGLVLFIQGILDRPAEVAFRWAAYGAMVAIGVCMTLGIALLPGDGAKVAERDRALALGKFLLIALGLCLFLLIDQVTAQRRVLWLLTGICGGAALVLFAMVHFELPEIKLRMPKWPDWKAKRDERPVLDESERGLWDDLGDWIIDRIAGKHIPRDGELPKKQTEPITNRAVTRPPEGKVVWGGQLHGYKDGKQEEEEDE